MLAFNHVSLATATTFTASLYFNQPFFLPFITFVAFSSLMPDIDHPGSEMSSVFPFVNKIFPHRGITHSMVGVVLFSLGLYFLLGYDKILSIVLVVSAFIGVQFLGEMLTRQTRQFKNLSLDVLSNKQIKFMIRGITAILDVFLILLVFLIWKDRFRIEILALLAFGYFAHLIGDFVTKEGIPVFWPIKKRIGLALFRTGSFTEVVIGFLLFIANIYLVYTFWSKFGLSNSSYWQNYLVV